MRRYTTPTHGLRVKNCDLRGCDVMVTYRQRGNAVTITNPAMEFDGTDTTLTVELSQLETGGFGNGRAEVQVNAVDQNNYRAASNILLITLRDNLLAKVV